MSSWSKVWDVECVTSLAVLPNAVCNRSECGLLPTLWRCVSFCPISYHKYWTLPKSCGQPVVGVGGAQEEQGQERLALCTS